MRLLIHTWQKDLEVAIHDERLETKEVKAELGDRILKPLGVPTD